MLRALPDRASRPIGEPWVWWFQRTRGLELDGDAGPQTRRALVEEYMARAGEPLGASRHIVTHGCGESFPLEGDVGVANETAAQNRRAEIYLFDGALGVQPPPPGPVSAAGSREYPEWARRARRTYDFRLGRVGVTAEYSLRVVDEHSRPLSGVDVHLSLAGGAELLAPTDADGVASAEGPAAANARATGIDLGALCERLRHSEHEPRAVGALPDTDHHVRLLTGPFESIQLPPDVLQTVMICSRLDVSFDTEPWPWGDVEHTGSAACYVATAEPIRLQSHVDDPEVSIALRVASGDDLERDLPTRAAMPWFETNAGDLLAALHREDVDRVRAFLDTMIEPLPTPLEAPLPPSEPDVNHPALSAGVEQPPPSASHYPEDSEP